MSRDSSSVTAETEYFSLAERAWLLQLARAAATAALGGPKLDLHPPTDPKFLRPGACFTTFKHKDHEAPGRGLRGCMGTLSAQEPLWECVKKMASETVTGDTRFAHDPITLAELPMLHIDLSVLHAPRALDDPLAFTLGEDGIECSGVADLEGYRGLYLPQVAVEFNMSKEQFLESCCSEKAGMPVGTWRDAKRCKVYAFRAEVFGE